VPFQSLIVSDRRYKISRIHPPAYLQIRRCKLSISLLAALTSFVLQKAIWVGLPPKVLFLVLIDSKMETNFNPTIDFRIFASFDEAHLTFQLSTLLFGNSLSSCSYCSLSIRVRSRTCVSRTSTLWINIHQSIRFHSDRHRL
jgi:hypothetical protein